MRYLSQMLRSSLFLAALLAVALPACGAPARAPSPLRNDTATVASAGPSIRSIDWMNRVYTSGAGGQPYQVENGEYEYAYDEDGNLVAPDSSRPIPTRSSSAATSRSPRPSSVTSPATAPRRR